MDAVYASKFITARKSKVLIEKLGRFTSRYRQEELDRKVLVSGRVKSQEERSLQRGYPAQRHHRGQPGAVQIL